MKSYGSCRAQISAFIDWLFNRKTMFWFVFAFVLTVVTAYVVLGILFSLVTALPSEVSVGILLIVLGGLWRILIYEFSYDQANQSDED